MHVLHVLNGSRGGSVESTVSIVKALSKHGVKSSFYIRNGIAKNVPHKLYTAVDGRIVTGPMYFWSRSHENFIKRIAGELHQAAGTLLTYRSSAQVMLAAESFGATMIASTISITPDGALAAMRLGLPHIWHIRELYGDQYYAPNLIWRQRLPASIQGSGYVICNTEFTRAALFGCNSEAEVVENIIGSEALGKLLGRYPSQRVPGIVHFGVIAGPAALKRHEFIITAAKELKKNIVRFKLHLIGFDVAGVQSSRVRAILRSVAHANLEDSVVYDGMIDDNVTAFQNIDVLVHAALQESFGRVYYEAGAAGRPVVACDSVAARRIIRDSINGFLVSPEDPREMAHKMLLLLDTEMVRKMGAAAHHFIESGYSDDLIAEKTVASYMKASKLPIDQKRFVAAIRNLLQ